MSSLSELIDGANRIVAEDFELQREGIPLQFQAPDRRKAREEALRALLVPFREGGPEVRRLITTTLTLEVKITLLAFAKEQSEWAIQTLSTECLRDGILAVAIEGGTVDWRDTLRILPLLYNSAEKLGVDPVPLFTEADRMVSSGFDGIGGFILRPPSERILAAWSWRERQTASGFRYD